MCTCENEYKDLKIQWSRLIELARFARLAGFKDRATHYLQEAARMRMGVERNGRPSIDRSPMLELRRFHRTFCVKIADAHRVEHVKPRRWRKW